MKSIKFNITLLAAVSMLVCGCSGNELFDGDESKGEGNSPTVFTLQANLPDELTKTAIDGNNKITWVDGDQIAVWLTPPEDMDWDAKKAFSSSSTAYALTGGAGTSSGSFSISYGTTPPKYVCYPYNENLALYHIKHYWSNLDGNFYVQASIPTDQYANDFGTDFGNNSYMVGQIEGSTINFHHAVSYLKVKTPSDFNGRGYIVVQFLRGGSMSDDLVTGPAAFNASTGENLEIAGSGGVTFEDYKDYVVIHALPFYPDTYYYAAVIPSETPAYIKIAYVYKNDEAHVGGEYVKTGSKKVLRQAGHILTIDPPGTLASNVWDLKREAVQLSSGGAYFATQMEEFENNPVLYSSCPGDNWKAWGLNWTLPTKGDLEGIQNLFSEVSSPDTYRYEDPYFQISSFGHNLSLKYTTSQYFNDYDARSLFLWAINGNVLTKTCASNGSPDFQPQIGSPGVQFWQGYASILPVLK
jgi:hypothetical protein